MGINYKDHIRTVENFPKPDIHFYDIEPTLGNAAVFASAIHDMADPLRGKVTKVVGLDARGFIFGAGMALELGVGFTMLRKFGKLPGETIGVEYALEYGTNKIELQADALTPEDKVVMVDDVIATGGTAEAGIELVRRTGASVVELTSYVDLSFLGGADRIRQSGTPVRSLISYDQ